MSFFTLIRRLIAYAWASPNTLLGIAIGLLLAGRFRWVDGVIEIYGRNVAAVLARLFVPAAALTMGHVVFGRDRHCLDSTRIHERVHVHQYERWGIAFLPAYILASVWLYARGRDGYRENPFEREAYAINDPQQPKGGDGLPGHHRSSDCT
jgi:hypothetical protein